MNIELLLKVKERILAEPEHFDMESIVNACGTTACIAGWTLSIAGSLPLATILGDAHIYIGAIDYAEDLLKLPKDTWERLFFDDHWPDQFRFAYQATDNFPIRAQIAADRIDHFIVTNGAE